MKSRFAITITYLFGFDLYANIRMSCWSPKTLKESSRSNPTSFIAPMTARISPMLRENSFGVDDLKCGTWCATAAYVTFAAGNDLKRCLE